MGPHFLYGDSDTPPHLVVFYDTLGIRRTHSRLNPRCPHGGSPKSIKRSRTYFSEKNMQGKRFLASYRSKVKTKIKIRQKRYALKTPLTFIQYWKGIKTIFKMTLTLIWCIFIRINIHQYVIICCKIHIPGYWVSIHIIYYIYMYRNVLGANVIALASALAAWTKTLKPGVGSRPVITYAYLSQIA